MSTLLLRKLAKRGALAAHRAAARVGVLAVPRHYYASMPDPVALNHSRSQWARPSSMRGVTIDLDAQAANLRRIVQPWQDEYRGGRIYEQATADAAGPGYGYIEAQALHGVLRSLKPRRVVEVGSGVSTAVMLAADRLNQAEGRPGAEFVCVEPHPAGWLREAPIRLVKQPVQRVPIATFEALARGDLLFIDSSHTVKTGGDVPRIVLEILPALAPGVVVHFHDIFLPYDYPRDAGRSLWDWQETALVHAWMIDNPKVSTLFCLSHLHYDRPADLAEVFPDYRPQPGENGLCAPDAPGHFPSSLYVEIAG